MANLLKDYLPKVELHTTANLVEQLDAVNWHHGNVGGGHPIIGANFVKCYKKRGEERGVDILGLLQT